MQRIKIGDLVGPVGYHCSPYYRVRNTKMGFKKVGAVEDNAIDIEADEKEILHYATQEIQYLEEARRRYRNIPRSFGLAEVIRPRLGYRWIGILMEHIDGYHLQWGNRSFYALSDRIDNQLRKVGIIHEDLHQRNIIVVEKKKRKRYFVIDFQPEFVSFVEPPLDKSK